MLSALCIEENAVRAVLSPAASAGLPATLALQPPGGDLAPANRVVTGPPGSADTSDVTREGSGIVFTGSIPLGGAPVTIDAAVPRPAAYAVALFRQALAARGVALGSGIASTYFERPPPGQFRTLWSHDSEPLAQMLGDFWAPSDNLIGEMLLRALGVARDGIPGTAESGVAFEAEWLRSLGIDPLRLDIVDGSGLSVYNRLTPRSLVTILQADWNGPNRAAVIDGLAVAGVRGTLSDDFKGTPVEGRVFAKTGTLRHVRSLSGYIRARVHGAITFSLMVDDWVGEDTAMKALQERMLERLIGGPRP